MGTGVGFGTFPLYQKKTTFVYPQLPQPPVLPTCDDSCKVVAKADMAGGGALHKKLPNITSAATCCAQCKADAECTSFVLGPDETAEDVATCFLLTGHVKALKYRVDRNYG